MFKKPAQSRKCQAFQGKKLIVFFGNQHGNASHGALQGKKPMVNPEENAGTHLCKSHGMQYFPAPDAKRNNSAPPNPSGDFGRRPLRGRPRKSPEAFWGARAFPVASGSFEAHSPQELPWLLCLATLRGDAPTAPSVPVAVPSHYLWGVTDTTPMWFIKFKGGRGGAFKAFTRQKAVPDIACV